jgi:hypothetical protein
MSDVLIGSTLNSTHDSNPELSCRLPSIAPLRCSRSGQLQHVPWATCFTFTPQHVLRLDAQACFRCRILHSRILLLLATPYFWQLCAQSMTPAQHLVPGVTCTPMELHVYVDYPTLGYVTYKQRVTLLFLLCNGNALHPTGFVAVFLAGIPIHGLHRLHVGLLRGFPLLLYQSCRRHRPCLHHLPPILCR